MAAERTRHRLVDDKAYITLFQVVVRGPYRSVDDEVWELLRWLDKSGYEIVRKAPSC